ncbi:MAG: GNAT family N-acetyltransferase [Opitutaceae bacterium]
MSTTTIRYARRDELPALAALARRVWKIHYPGIITEGQIDYMLARGYAIPTLEAELEAGIAFPLLWSDGNLIGLASFGPGGRQAEAKLHKLYLDPDFHGHGLGQKLLSWIEAEAVGRGFNRIVLQVNKQNTKAIAAYRRRGFTVRTSLVVDIGGGYLMDDYLMEKDLLLPGTVGVGKS